MSESNVLATIPRSSTEEIHIQINEYKGKKYLDLRVFYTTDEGASWSPTKKGITLPPEKLQDLIDAVEKAKEEFGVAAAED